MCFLSPQHMAQQTMCKSDGFHSQWARILTFPGLKCPIYCNYSNNLPIIFFASDFTTTDNIASNTNLTSFLGSADSSSNQDTYKSSTQQKLLNTSLNGPPKSR